MGGTPTPPPPGSQVLVKVEFDNRPIVTYTLMGITIFIFLLQMATEYMLGTDIPAGLGLKANDAILAGQIWRLITPVFLHGSILHIGFNMYALYVLGPGLERHYGHWRFLVLYLLSGFAGNVASFLFTISPSLGASTAIFGLLAAQGIFLYQNRRLFGASAQRGLINIIVIAVINLVIGLSPGIDNWGHLGGLVGGTLFAWFAGPQFMVQGAYPNLILVDIRPPGAALRAGLSVAALFVLLAALIITIRLR
jgi:rhomboid protease GluP